jgi:large subunit ribosomal protein L49
MIPVLRASALSSAQLVRHTHSKSFLKRKMGHPASRPQRPAPADVEPPRIPTQPVCATASGWAPPSGASTASLPFQVRRTLVGNQLPVYRDYLNGRTRTMTIIRKVEGDAQALAEEVVRVTGGASVTVRPGRVEVEGDRADQLKLWLGGVGF